MVQQSPSPASRVGSRDEARASVMSTNTKPGAAPKYSKNAANKNASLFTSTASGMNSRMTSRYNRASMMSGVGNKAGRLGAEAIPGTVTGSNGRPLEMIRIYDEHGNDVTPLPLVAPSARHGGANSAGAAVAVLGGKLVGGTASMNLNAADLAQLMRSSADVMAEAFNKMETQTLGSFAGGGSVFRSTATEDPSGAAAGSVASSNSSRAQSQMSQSVLGSISQSDELGARGAGKTGAALGGDAELAAGYPDLPLPYPGASPPRGLAPLVLNPPLTAADLGRQVSVVLTETATVPLFDLPSVSVLRETVAEEFDRVVGENERYRRHKADQTARASDVHRGCQTYNLPAKHKDIQATQPPAVATAAMATAWNIYDAQQELRQKLAAAGEPDADDADAAGASADAGTTSGAAAATGAEAERDIAASIEATSAMLLSEGAVNSLGGAGGSNGLAFRSTDAGTGTGMSMASAMGLSVSQSMMDGGSSAGSQSASMLESSATDLTQARRSSSSANGAAAAMSALAARGRAAVNDKQLTECFFKLHHDSLQTSMNIMERAVLGSMFQERLLIYRGTATGPAAPDARSSATDSEAELSRQDADAQQLPPHNAAAELASLQFNVASVQHLWAFRCELTRGRQVNALCWNPRSRDILAVAYGASTLSAAGSPGLVLCWSVQNPDWPERVYPTKAPATCLDFGRVNPCLLSVGLQDGNVVIYDVRRKDSAPAIDLTGTGQGAAAGGVGGSGGSSGSRGGAGGAGASGAAGSAGGAGGDAGSGGASITGKHRAPVWEVRWINLELYATNSLAGGDEAQAAQQQNHNEALVSVSTDGRVLQHQIKMGIEHVELALLKPVAVKPGARPGDNSNHSAAAAGDAGSGRAVKDLGRRAGGMSMLSRNMGGLCLDFGPLDNSIYLVGTEDGNIHLCSTTYNEQYLATFSGHMGPVYKVKWNAFRPSMFLSCSSDWTVRLWDQKQSDALLKLQNAKDSISDIAWSPQLATVFATTSIDGTLEIWDLNSSILDPFVTYTVLDRSLTAVVFGVEGTSVILTGDTNGTVDVYKIRGMPASPLQSQSREEQGAALAGILSSSALPR